MKRARSVGAIAIAAAMLMSIQAPASAEERKCRGTIGAKTVDNLKVPAGARCVLKGTKVKGTITVNRKAFLKAQNVNVVGNVQAENARNVKVINGSQVGGSIQVVQGKAALVRGTKVNGDILFDDQRGFLKAKNNRIGGNLQAFQNTDGVRIVTNVIDGNLQCKSNKPAPTGYGNKVKGSKEDQCKKL